jgi:hypothetical protein
MLASEPSPLADWESFYVIVGSAAGALTGLMFVAMTLVTTTRGRAPTTTLRAYATPTVVHFSTVILVAGGLSAPWHSLGRPSWFIGLVGGAGVAYGGMVIHHAWAQTDYQAVRADWVWYNLLPMVAYVTFVVAAVLLSDHVRPSGFAIAAASMLLLVIGIHNAWDTVTYIATGQNVSDDE